MLNDKTVEQIRARKHKEWENKLKFYSLIAERICPECGNDLKDRILRSGYWCNLCKKTYHPDFCETGGGSCFV